MYFRTSNIIRSVLIVAGITISGCDIFDAYCDDVAYPAIELTVKNTAGEYVCDQVTAVVFENNFIDTLREGNINEAGEVISLRGAYEHSGIYSLVITSDIYQTYTDTQIKVSKDKCNVNTKRLSVIVEPK